MAVFTFFALELFYNNCFAVGTITVLQQTVGILVASLLEKWEQQKFKIIGASNLEGSEYPEVATRLNILCKKAKHHF